MEQPRLHIGLGVSDVDRATDFYRLLFDQEPTKTRPGYAKFEVDAPPVSLALIEEAGRGPAASRVTHYGIKLDASERVWAAAERLRALGLDTKVEKETLCCYGVQDKVWVTDPDGHAWEVYAVVEADVAERSACCGPEAGIPPREHIEA